MTEIKISFINFFDYRAFYNGRDNEYFINLEGKNLLIYGENGSGKTSLFRGLKDFVHGEDFITHNQTPRESEGYIEVGFTDGSKDRLEEAGAKPTKSEILNTAKLNSFLSYKDLLKTYLFEDDKEINFFDLLINGVLKNHQLNSLGELNPTWKGIINKTVEVEVEKIQVSFDAGEISKEEADELKEGVQGGLTENINNFNSEFSQLLKKINTELSRFLDYFKQSLDVTLELEPIELEKYEETNVQLSVKLFEQPIQTHQDFLNEARLSAIAISIYLAALKLNPTSDAVKFIFLDDVFLGLDTSNRIPLMNIMNTEFNDWQILITTYDRHWFEVGKKHLIGEWKEIEMYAGQKDDGKFEIPVIIQESSDYLDRANKYFMSKDYPACSNYLRKELEKLIKQRLPEEFLRNFDGKPKPLVHLWKLCVERYSNLKTPVDADVMKLFDLTRLVLLNPMSHDSMHHPIYKRELTDAFKLVDKLRAHPVINQIIILTKGTQLKFQHPSQNYSFEFKLTQDWRLDIHNGFRCVDYPKCKIVHWQFNDTSFWDFKRSVPLSSDSQNKALLREDKLIKVIENLLKITKLAINKNILLSNTLVEDQWTLKSYFDKIEDTDKSGLDFIRNVWMKVKNFRMGG